MPFLHRYPKLVRDSATPRKPKGARRLQSLAAASVCAAGVLLIAQLATIAWLSPFPSMFQTPIDVLSGRSTGTEALAAIGMQVGWAAALFAVTRVVGARAVRRVAAERFYTIIYVLLVGIGAKLIVDGLRGFGLL